MNYNAKIAVINALKSFLSHLERVVKFTITILQLRLQLQSPKNFVGFVVRTPKHTCISNFSLIGPFLTEFSRARNDTQPSQMLCTEWFVCDERTNERTDGQRPTSFWGFLGHNFWTTWPNLASDGSFWS